jgi:hypothetical protein
MFLVMIVAASITSRMASSPQDGIELPMLYAMGALVLTFTGPGGYSLDRVLGLLWLSNEQFASRAIWIAVAVGVVMIAARQGLAQRTAHAT